LGLNQFDEDDVRLLEVLAGHAAVAVENARLYESARREAESATALLEFWREDDDGMASVRKVHGHDDEQSQRIEVRRYDATEMRRVFAATNEPFVVSP